VSGFHISRSDEKQIITLRCVGCAQRTLPLTTKRLGCCRVAYHKGGKLHEGVVETIDEKHGKASFLNEEKPSGASS